MITETGMGMELKEIHIIPGCGKNIISLTQLQKEGWDYYSKSGKLFLKRDDKEIELKEKERSQGEALAEGDVDGDSNGRFGTYEKEQDFCRRTFYRETFKVETTTYGSMGKDRHGQQQRKD